MCFGKAVSDKVQDNERDAKDPYDKKDGRKDGKMKWVPCSFR